jgi:hypothetical protein
LRFDSSHVEECIYSLKDGIPRRFLNLPEPDLIVREIAKDLEAALEQFREIVGDLSEKKAAR